MGPFNSKFIISAAGERVGFGKRPFPVSTTSPFGRREEMSAGGRLMQGWQPTGRMSTGRVGHPLTLLHNGVVLINGGGTAEVYLPDDNAWIVTASPSLPRSHHSATLLRDGNVLVAGGTDDLRTEIFDPSTQTWSFTGPLNFARSYHAATELADGRVLVVGGSSLIAATSAEIYDSGTQAWTVTRTTPNQGRQVGHTATLLSDGRVLVVGGLWTSALDSTELFDPTTETWTVGQKLSSPRFDHTATRLQDGKVLVVGGRELSNVADPSCEVFYPDSGDWITSGVEPQEARYGHTAVLLYTGNAMVVGGYSSGRFRKSAEFYNPEMAEWYRGPDMATPRSAHTQTLLRRDLHTPLEFKVLVAGGWNNDSESLDTAELFTSGEVSRGERLKKA